MPSLSFHLNPFAPVIPLANALWSLNIDLACERVKHCFCRYSETDLFLWFMWHQIFLYMIAVETICICIDAFMLICSYGGICCYGLVKCKLFCICLIRWITGQCLSWPSSLEVGGPLLLVCCHPSFVLQLTNCFSGKSNEINFIYNFSNCTLLECVEQAVGLNWIHWL